jgi:hypothetical protein
MSPHPQPFNQPNKIMYHPVSSYAVKQTKSCISIYSLSNNQLEPSHLSEPNTTLWHNQRANVITQ